MDKYGAEGYEKYKIKLHNVMARSHEKRCLYVKLGIRIYSDVELEARRMEQEAFELEQCENFKLLTTDPIWKEKVATEIASRKEKNREDLIRWG